MSTVFTCVLVSDTARGILFPTLWLNVKRFGGTKIAQGMVIGAFSFGRIVSSPVLGWWCEYHGSLSWLILSQFVIGLGAGSLGVSRSYVAEHSLRVNRTINLAYLTSLQYMGFTVMPLLGAILASIGHEHHFSMLYADKILVGGCLLNIATKGTIGVYETLGSEFVTNHFNWSSVKIGYTFSACGLVGVTFLLSFEYLGRHISDIDLTISGIIGYPVGHTAVLGMYSKVIKTGPQGTVQGWFGSAGSFARIFFPFIAGILSEYTNDNTIFGVMGLTGSQFVKVAIDNGHKVKVLLRSPDKLDPTIRNKVEIFQGSNEESKKSHFMNEFIINLIPSLKQYKVRLLYQAGAFSPRYNEKSRWDVYIVRKLIGYTYMLADNDDVIKTLAESKDVEWIVTRPGFISNDPSKGTLRPIDGISHASTAIDLATYSLSLIQNDNALRSNDCV
eukprot:gene18232-23903_t